MAPRTRLWYTGARADMKTAAFAALALIAAAAPLRAEEASAAPDAAEIRARLERLRRAVGSGAAETANADRTTIVSGDLLPYPDRVVLLGFVDDLRTALEGQLGARRAAPELVPAVSFRGPDFRVAVRALADPDGTNAPASVRTSLRPRRDAVAFRQKNIKSS